MSTILFKGAELPKIQDDIKKYEPDQKQLLPTFNVPLKSSLDNPSSSAQCQNTVLKIPGSSINMHFVFSSFINIDPMISLQKDERKEENHVHERNIIAYNLNFRVVDLHQIIEYGEEDQKDGKITNNIISSIG